ncbi:hypothetical protein DFH06DRAFT_1476591 [Mycena polygramma]|nr:hypothetical protein DFH06DRAFT_1476591 [Mycena polygramma]
MTDTPTFVTLSGALTMRTLQTELIGHHQDRNRTPVVLPSHTRARSRSALTSRPKHRRSTPKQLHHEKTYHRAIEKEFKAKQTQEGYVTKAREKYENDCVRINSYTAQLGLAQGKDAERIHLKLERAQGTVVQNERDFTNFARALADTVAKWEQDWKVFCDSCQDLEEDRLEFTMDNMRAYVNAVSTVCSCEKMYLALEQMEPEKGMENPVRDYGTGKDTRSTCLRQIHRPQCDPHLVVPRDLPPVQLPAIFSAPASLWEREVHNVQRGDDLVLLLPGPPLFLDRTRRVAAQALLQYWSSNLSIPRQSTRNPSHRVPPRDPLAEPIDPTADAVINVGPNAYKADLTRDPTQPDCGYHAAEELAQHPVTACDDGVWGSSACQHATLLVDVEYQCQRAAHIVHVAGYPRCQQPDNYLESAAYAVAVPGLPILRGSRRERPSVRVAPVVAHPRTTPAPISAASVRPTSAAGRPGSEIITEVLSDYHQSQVLRALFDYQATIDEEFDFQQGDIIAVAATPEDGWWSGELLHDSRRVPGKHIFPSNFIQFF